MCCLFSVYFVNQPLHISGIFVAHHQKVYIFSGMGAATTFGAKQVQGIYTMTSSVYIIYYDKTHFT